MWMQCAEFLNAKLPGWQEICSDATKVPEKVKMMIEEIRTPGSTPISGTPQPSPMIERNTMVCHSLIAQGSLSNGSRLASLVSIVLKHLDSRLQHASAKI